MTPTRRLMTTAMAMAMALACTAAPRAGAPAGPPKNGAARIACPAHDAAGRTMRKGENGTLFFGDPARNAMMAPDLERGDTGIFRLPKGGAGIVLVCNYEGGPSSKPIPVPPEARECRQDPHSFTCG